MIHEHIIITHWLTQNAMNPSMKLSALKDFDNLPDKVRAALPVTVLNNIQKMRTDTGQPVPHTPLIHPPRHRKRKRKPKKNRNRQAKQEQ